jgi:transcriptional regulator with XRE-family HTH domain
MGVTPEPNYHGRKLIRELQLLRRRAGLTQAETGARAHIELKKLSRIETRQLPSYHELCTLLDVYGVLSSDWGPYLELWEHSKQPPWWRPYGLKDTRYLRMEQEALFKYEFQLGYVPDLLQTPDYARSAFTNSADFRSDETIDVLVEIRMRQQQRLLEGDLTLYTLIHEPVLHQAVDHAQRDQLIERAALPNVTLQVVPQDQQVHDGLRGSVVLLSFPDNEPDIAFADSLVGLNETQDTSNIKRAIDRTASLALSPSESVGYIKSLPGR